MAENVFATGLVDKLELLFGKSTLYSDAGQEFYNRKSRLKCFMTALIFADLNYGPVLLCD